MSERRACVVIRLNRGTYRYQSHQDPRTELRMRMREIAAVRVRYGCRKILVLLQREGWAVGKSLVMRLYREEGLALRRTVPRKRRVVRNMERRERMKPAGPNQVWSLDFVSDPLADGRRFRALTVVDVYTRESLAIEAGQSLRGEDVVRVLQSLQKDRGGPEEVVLRQRLGILQSGGGPVGLSEWGEDRLLAAGASRPTTGTSSHSTGRSGTNV